MGKGSAYEREFCKELSLWWTNGNTDDVFWRSSNSGGRATLRAAKGKRTSGQHGDVAATDVDGVPLMELLTMELKRGYSKFTIQDVMDRKPYSAIQKWEEWLHQVWTSAANAGSCSWLLVTQRDRRDALVYMPTKFWSTLVVNDCITDFTFPVLCFDGFIKMGFPRLDYPKECMKEIDVTCIRWESWKTFVDADQVRKLTKKKLQQMLD